MPIKIQCTCGRAFSVAEAEAGKKAFCPVCGVQNLVPEPDSGGAARIVLVIVAVLVVAGIAYPTVRHFLKKHGSAANAGGPGSRGLRVADNPGGVPSHTNGSTNPSHPTPSPGGTENPPVGGTPTDHGSTGGNPPGDAKARLKAAAEAWLQGLPRHLPLDKLARFQAAVTLLTGGSEDGRVKVLEEWMREGDKEAGPLIGALMEDESPRVRLAALKAAVSLDATFPTNVLEKLLQDTDLSTRALAVIVAGLRGIHGAVQSVRPLLGDAQLRPLAAEALGLLHDQDSSEEIAKGLADPAAAVRLSAYFSLGRLGSFHGGFPIEVIRDPDPSVKAAGVAAAGYARAEMALPSLLGLLQDTDPGVRRAAAESLGMLGKETDAQALLPLLGDTDASVRYEAARSLGLLRARVAAASIVPLLADPARATGVSDIEAAATMLGTAKQINPPLDIPEVSTSVREGALLAIEQISSQHFDGKTLDERIAKAQQWWARAQQEYPR